jgi:Zn-dependent M28 family amino/carboxypeptidase
MRPLPLLSAALATAATATGLALAEPEFSPERFKAHVAFLADDLLEGRDSGSRGHEIASRYIATQLAGLGVKPGARDGTFLQPVTLMETEPAGTPSLVITTPTGRRPFAHGKTAVIRGPVAGGTATVKGPMVFVGFGMTDSVVGVDDYAGLDVRGKVAVILSGIPKGMDSEVAAHLYSVQGRTASEHGAVGVVYVRTRSTAAVSPWPQALRYADVPSTTWVRDDGTPFDPRHGIAASATLEDTAAAAIFDGAPRTLAQVLDAADTDGGRPQGFPLPATAAFSVTTKTRRYTSPDVIGIIEGADPVLKQEYVAFMGHSDHIGVKKTGEGDRINNGALDNAAGVATLLEVARAFVTGPRPRRSVLVVANTAEEKGLLGAEYFAHSPTVPIEKITAAIDLDMPILLYDFTDVVAYGAGHSTLEGVFRQAGAAMGVTLAPDPMPAEAIFVRSDHYAMVKAGVPAVMLATGMANGGKAAWDTFLSKHYHQPSDDLAQPIVWSAGARFAELNYRVVRALADADTPARWYEQDYFGQRFAPQAPKAPRP